MIASALRAERAWAALVSAALVAVACTSGVDQRNTTPAPTHPASVNAGAIRTTTPIKHVVFIIKENRSFDNLFGRFPGADGAMSGYVGDQSVPLGTGFNVIPADLPHAYAQALTDWNHGAMDGFAQNDLARHYAYTAMQPGQIPNYWRFAKDFVLADNFYASAMGPSFPNHLFTIAATSAQPHDGP